jgi:hypothetical protein
MGFAFQQAPAGYTLGVSTMIELAIAPAVERTRRFYRQQAADENLPLATIVAKHYRTILRLPEVIAIEQQAKAGNAPKCLRVREWSPQAVAQLAALATVLLAVEFGLA